MATNTPSKRKADIVVDSVTSTGEVTGSNLNVSNWDTAYGWGNHASAGYITSESDTLDSVTDRGASTTNTLTVGTLNTGVGGSITAYTNVTASYGYVSASSGASGGFRIGGTRKDLNWDTAYNWGNHADAGYLTSHQDISGKADLTGDTFTGTVISTKSTIGSIGGNANMSNAGFLAGSTANGIGIDGNEIVKVGGDTFFINQIGDNPIEFHLGASATNSKKLSITTGGIEVSGTISATGYNKSNWDTAYGWGDHSTAGYLTSYTETDTLDSVTDRGASTTNGITVGSLTISTNNDTIVTNHAAMRRGSSGEAYIDAPGHVILNIDTNNNNTDRYFAIRKDATTTNLFSVNESGNADLPSGGLKSNWLDTHGNQFWRSPSDAYQRVDSRDEGTLARAHWYGVSTTGGTSNFRHAWYDGDSYVYITAENDGVSFGGALNATSYKVSNTTVIDSARNLSNIGTISASGSISVTGYNSVSAHSGSFSYITGALTGNVTGNLTGNADTATKWQDARTITLGGDLTGSVSLDGSSDVTLSAQVINDSHTHDGRYYTESEIQTFMNRGYISGHGASNLPVGWYTIATNSGDRASARFGIWDGNSGDHQSVTFYASHHFGTDSSNTLTVLDNSYYSGNPFRYIRIKDAGTYDGAALQIYIDDASNSVSCAILGDNFQSSGWVLCDWIPDATTPPSVSNYANFGERSRVDLNQIAQGGFATTGEIYAGGDTTLHRVFHDAYHPNADKWTTARTLSLTGDVTGSVSWDGSANASITTTVNDNSHNHHFIVSDSPSDEPSNALQYLNTNGTTTDSPTTDWYNIIRMGHGNPNTYYNSTLAMKMTGSNVGALYGRVRSNGTAGAWSRFFDDNYHPNADKWTTARTLSLTGDVTGSVSLDGSANASISATVVNDSHTHDTRYVQQGGTSFSGEYPMVVRVSDRNFYSDGNIRFEGATSKLTVDGIVNTPTYQVNGTTVIDSSRNISGVNLNMTGTITTWTNNDNALVLRQGQSGHPWNYIEFRNSANDRNWYAGTSTSGNFEIQGETGATGGVNTNKYFNSIDGYKVGTTTVIDSSRNISNVNQIRDNSGSYFRSAMHSGSDFANGTLVTTSIPASSTNGASFVIEVTGKSYSSNPPFSFIAQGYLYNNTIINYSGVNNGDLRLTYIKAMNNNGYLSFWWPRVSYWNSFEVHVRDAGGNGKNTVTAITNSVDPSGATKKVTINLHKSVCYDENTNIGDLHANNYKIGSTTVIDSSRNATFNSVSKSAYNQAYLLTSSGTSSSGSAIGFQQVTAEGWSGIFVDFNPYEGWGLYHDNPNNYFCVTAETSVGGLRSFTVPNRGSGTSTAHEKIRLNQNDGSIIAGGSITSYGNVTAYASDRRLKENFINIDSALDRVIRLNGCFFDWREDKMKETGFRPDSVKHDIGLIAQEVQAVVPEAVDLAPFDTEYELIKDGGDKFKVIEQVKYSKSGQNYLTVKYDKLVPLLIEAIKELKSEIEELKNVNSN